MGVLPEWFEQHWPNYRHEQLYAWVRTEANGVGEVQATADEMGEFGRLMAESVDDVEQALAEAGVSWQGLAADSMDAGVSPLAQWARDACTATEASVHSAQQVGESFGHVSRVMPEPVSTPDREVRFPPSIFDLVAAQRDQDAVERAAQEAKQRAVELMDSYSGASAAAADTLGVFVPPQGVTVAAPEPPAGSADSAFGSIDGSGGRDTGAGPGESGDGTPAEPEKAGPVEPGDGAPGGPGGSSPVGAGEGAPGGESAGQGGDRPGTVTDPSRVTLPQAPGPLAPVAGPPAPGSPPVGSPPPVIVGGPGNGGGPGGGRGASGGWASGRGPVGSGPVGGGRGVAGGLPGETVVRGRSGVAGVGGPVGVGQRGDDDEEHKSPDYLRDYRDDFWDDTPPVAPAVIGEDEDDC